jgi:uncharacterized protein (UPF0261 family)
MGLVGKPQETCDITREEILSVSGRTPEEVVRVTDRGKRMPMMVDGAKEKVRQLYSSGQLDGIISIGGTTGTQMGTRIMMSLPFGVPKFAVSSSITSCICFEYIGTADIVLMHSVVEIAGLNNLMKCFISGCWAICGMVDGSAKALFPRGKDEKPLIAMTHFGLVRVCVNVEAAWLDEARSLVFSAAGVEDRAMERYDRQNILVRSLILLPVALVKKSMATGAAGPWASKLQAREYHRLLPQL